MTVRHSFCTLIKHCNFITVSNLKTFKNTGTIQPVLLHLWSLKTFYCHEIMQFTQ